MSAEEGSPEVTVIHGRPTDVELAAILAALAIGRAAATRRGAREPVNLWGTAHALLPPGRTGPDAWRTSLWPLARS